MTTSLPVPATPALVEDLRRVCAETVEIPLDKVTPEADLVADLGVDSLTMGELESCADEGPSGQIPAQRLFEDLLRLVVRGKLHASVQHLSMEPRRRRSGRIPIFSPISAM